MPRHVTAHEYDDCDKENSNLIAKHRCLFWMFQSIDFSLDFEKPIDNEIISSEVFFTFIKTRMLWVHVEKNENQTHDNATSTMKNCMKSVLSRLT